MGLYWGLNKASAGSRVKQTRAIQEQHTQQRGWHKSVCMTGTAQLMVGLGCAALMPWLAAGYNLQCDEAWSGPSKGNDIVECLSKYPQKEPGMLVPPAVAAAVLLAVLMTPLVFVCRLLGGCGASKPRPGGGCCCGGSEWDGVPEAEKLIMYPRPYVFRIKLSAWLTLVASVVVIGLFAAGGKLLTNGATGAFTSARVDVVGWIQALSEAVQQELSTLAVSSTELDAAFVLVDDFIDSARVEVEVVRKWNDANSRWILGGIVAAGCFPFVALLVPVVLACCNVRKCVPGCCSCAMACIGAVYGVLGVLGVTMGIVVTVGCGEIDLHKGAQPGVIQWLVVPLCQDVGGLGELVKNIAEVERKGAEDVCTELRKVCDAAAATDPNSPDFVFVCDPQPMAGSTPCTGAEAVSTYTRSLRLKAGASSTCALCTFSECADHCTGTLQSTVQSTDAVLSRGVKVLQTLNRLAPLVGCDALVTRAFEPLQGCTGVAAGALCVGVGAVLATLLCMCAMIVLLKGSKVFFNRESMKKRAQELYAASPKVAPPMPHADL